MQPQGPFIVRRGAIRCYRLFDLGDEIDLSDAVLKFGSASLRLTHLQRRGVRAMEPIAVPARIDLGPRGVPLGTLGPHVQAGAELHLFSYGTVALCYKIPIGEGTPLDGLVATVGPLYESSELRDLALRELDALSPTLRSCIRGHHDWSGCETYTIVHIQELDGQPTADQVLAWPGLAALLLGEASPSPLSERQRQEVLQYAFSYFEHDLAVIDWNSAFLVDPGEESGMAEMLEFANSQLLNLRYHDEQLEAEIERVHQALARRRSPGVLFSPYSRLAHDLFRRLMDLSARVERIDNTIKVAGTFHLSRAYHAAIERLRVSIWRQSIERKHALAASAYSMLKSETETRRGMWLEITVVILIMVEIVIAVINGH